MSKKNDLARKELDEILKGLMTDKKMKSSDKQIIGITTRSITYHSNPDAIEKRKKKNAEITSTDEWKKKIADSTEIRKNDPVWKEKNKIANKEKWKNKETKEKHLNSVRERAQDPQWQENVKKSNQSKPNDPKYMDALHKGIEKRSQGDWYEKNARKNTLRLSKPILTPFGVFPSRITAVKTLTNVVNIGGKINKGIKEKDSGYRYITQEEYIMLTGKDPFK